MKIAVFSDSHGYTPKMLDAIYDCSPDLIIHLGDGNFDIDKIEKQFPLIPLKAVRGNCDFSPILPETDLFTVSGIKIMITHGHLFGVKSSTASLTDMAKKAGADIVMYGHTHVADYFEIGKLLVINPGSCGFSSLSSFAEVIISDKGIVSCRIIRL